MFATLLKHTKSKQYVCHFAQTYQIETVCLPSISNIPNRFSMFALLHININHLILPTQGFWELPVSHVVNILLCCSQISIGLVRDTDVGSLIMALDFSSILCASFTILWRCEKVRLKPSQYPQVVGRCVRVCAVQIPNS